MAWSDRRPIYEPAWNPKHPGDAAILWLIGTMVALHALRIVLEGTRVIEEGDGIRWFGLSVDGLDGNRLWQPVSYAFVHAGLRSLIWYMLLLYVGGRLYEGFVGSRRMLEVFAVCVLGASLALCLRRPDVGGATAPAQVAVQRTLTGSAGAAWGILTALLVRAPDYPVNAAGLFVVPLKGVVFLLAGIEVCFALGNDIIEGSTVDSLWSPVFGSATALVMVWGWPRIARPKFRSLRRRAARRREVEEAQQRVDDERELDRILEKINREGLPSLSGKERHFLQRASNRYQDSRGP